MFLPDIVVYNVAFLVTIVVKTFVIKSKNSETEM